MELKKNTPKLIASFMICYSVIIIAYTFVNPDSLDIWSSITKPKLFPSDAAYGVIWPLQLTLMATALFLIWKKGFNKYEIQMAFVNFILHLSLLTLWTFLFGYLTNAFFIFFIHVCTIITLIYTAILFYKISKPAGILLISVLPIRLFGFYLFIHLVALNPQLLSR